MPSEIEELIEKLRKAEERRHVASLQAIDTLEKNMIGSGEPGAEDSPGAGGGQTEEPGPKGNGREGTAGDASNVDRVLDALETQRFKPFDEIVELTELDEARVRAVLYGRSLQSRIQKRRIDKRMAFRMATKPPPRKSQKRRGKGPSAADRVRAVLRQHPDGLRAGAIREQLPDIGANTIGSSLYNMKNKSKKVIYDESTETYRLA